MTINIYSSITDNEPAETHERNGVSVSDFVLELVPDFKDGETQPFSCAINGELVEPTKWKETVINESDYVEFRVVPKGTGLEIVAYFAIAAAVAGASYSLYQANQADVLAKRAARKQGGVARGNSLEGPNAKANMPKLGAVVPEGFGRSIRYPDYLNQPRKSYTNPINQRLEMLVAVGAGDYFIPESDIKLNDTSLFSVGGTYKIYSPGSSLAGDPAADNWYHAPGIGSTQSSFGITIPYSHADPWLVSYESLESTYESSQQRFRTYFSIIKNNTRVGDYVRIHERFTLFGGDGAFRANIESGKKFFGTGETVDIFFTDPEDAYLNGVYRDVYMSSDPVNNHFFVNEDYTSVNAPIKNRECFITSRKYTYRISEIVVPTTAITYFKYQRYIGDTLDTATPSFADGYSPFTKYDYVKNENMTLFLGPYSLTPRGELSSKIEIDIIAPNGLGVINSDGTITARTVFSTLYFRKKGDIMWNGLIADLSARSRDGIGGTASIDLESIGLDPEEYEVIVKRYTPTNTSSNVLDNVELIAARSRLPRVDTYPDCTVMTVTVDGYGDMYQGTEQQLNIIAERKLIPFDKPSSPPVPTRRIADAFYHVAKSVGYEDEDIDMVELERLNAIWESRGETFDYFFDETTVKDAMNTILEKGYSALTVDHGILRPVRDEVKTGFEEGYSPENMVEPLRRTFTSIQPDDFTGVQVEYTDPTTWTRETVNCLLPGDSVEKLDKFTIEGVVTKRQAWRIGMRRRRSQVFRRWSYDFTTELDSLNSGYLSYVPLVDNVPGYGKVALMREITDSYVVLSEPLTWEAGKSHVIAYRDLDGSVVGPFPATQGADEYTVLCSIPAPLPVNYADKEQVHFYFGTTERWSFPALITEITPQGGKRVGVAAINYDARVYADDNNSPPA